MKDKYSFTSSIGSLIVRYLDLKQALGRQYEKEYRIFVHLDKFLCIKKCDLTAESFSMWCQTRNNLTPTILREWMRIVRGFCLYRQRSTPKCFIPDPMLFPKKHQPMQPHIFTEEQIVRLFNVIENIKPGIKSSPLKKENTRLALVLLYTSGLRCGELRRLIIKDYNPIDHTLLIRESKFRKSRLIPLSKDGWSAIDEFLKIRRQRRLPSSLELPLIWHRYGAWKFYTRPSTWAIFHSLFSIANIHTAYGKFPRIHDFRHTFAVRVLLRWYREDVNVQSKLPLLSVYMGHSSVVHTQYYLRCIDDVLSLASERFEKSYSTLITEL